MSGNSYIHTKQWKYSFLFTGESNYSSTGNLDSYSCILVFESSSTNIVACPSFVASMYCNPSMYPPVPSKPNKLVCVVVGYGTDNIRTKCMDAIEKKTHLAYGGSHRNNIGGSIVGRYNSTNVLDFFREYSFAITTENTGVGHYITEKLMNGIKSGIVPIYYGSPHIAEYFNTKRFLLLKTGSDEEI